MHFSSLGTRLLNFAQSQPDYSQKPIGFSWRSNKIFIASSVGAGLFTDLFLYGLIVPVLPFMLVDHVGMPQDQVQGHVSSLLAAYAGARCHYRQVQVKTSTFSAWGDFLNGSYYVACSGAYHRFTHRRKSSARSQCMLCMVYWHGTTVRDSRSRRFGEIHRSYLWCHLYWNAISTYARRDTVREGGLAAVFILAFAILATDFICRLVIIEAKDAEQYNKLDYTNSSSGEDRFGVDNDATEDATP
ncbi:hypothetical protein TrVFT333_009391 [Trichoderma virens FT-333]|nr:hypothetical protein TrVFT333_009391 [Trichoderma virens FT-333]